MHGSDTLLGDGGGLNRAHYHRRRGSRDPRSMNLMFSDSDINREGNALSSYRTFAEQHPSKLWRVM